MNVQPNAVKVLCYGDSNTWGQKPDRTGRYEVNVRWTGVLQTLLGNNYDIVEEGLSSRTTDLDYGRKPGRNGKTYLTPCLISQSPVDVVAIMLGTNDLKTEYNRTAQDVANAIKGLVDDVRQYAQDRSGTAPKIILISPIYIDDTAPHFSELYTGYYHKKGVQESHKLSAVLSEMARQMDCRFVDAASVSKPGEDGIHLSLDSQAPLAELLRVAIQSPGASNT